MRLRTKIRLSLLCWFAGLAIASFFGLLPAGCTGKSIELYHPQTGKAIAKYRNTTDSEIGGLHADFNAATGDFSVDVETSAQSASSSNAQMWETVGRIVDKIPVVPP